MGGKSSSKSGGQVQEYAAKVERQQNLNRVREQQLARIREVWNEPGISALAAEEENSNLKKEIVELKVILREKEEEVEKLKNDINVLVATEF